jgi:tRNA A37 methylthiotransferase MiaB
MLARLEAGEERITGLDNDTDETFETEVTRRDNPWRAYLTIIEGCDKACAYCVVPFTRGPERSRDSGRVLAELRSLANMGYSEVQFLGQTVNSYADPSPRRMRFSQLLLDAAQVPGIRRYGSLLRIHATSRRILWRRSTRIRPFATTSICRCNPVRHVCCVRCSGRIRARSIWKRLR